MIKRIGMRSLSLLGSLVGLTLFCLFLFISQIISLPAFIFVLIGSSLLFGFNIWDRKREMVKETHQWIKKSEVEIQKRQWNCALKYLDEALILKPGYIKALLGKGYCYREMAQYTSAISIYLEILREKPDYVEALYLLGICYFKERMLKKAFECFEKILLINPDYMEAYLFLGDLHKFEGNNPKALEYYQQYLAKCKDEKIAHTVMEKIESTKTLLDQLCVQDR